MKKLRKIFMFALIMIVSLLSINDVNAISKSKNAKELDSNLKSKVTLSIPSEGEEVLTDVVFVADYSSCKDESVKKALKMLERLQEKIEQTNAKVNIGAVIYRGTVEDEFTMSLTELNEDSLNQIKLLFNGNQPHIKGSNMHAGLLAAKEMLENSKTPNDRKFVILISDGLTYTWSTEDYGSSDSQMQVPLYFTNDGVSKVWISSPYDYLIYYGEIRFAPVDWKEHLNRIATKVENTIQSKYAKIYDRNTTYDKEDSLQPVDGSFQNSEYVSSTDVALYKSNEVYKYLLSKGYNVYSYAVENTSDYEYGYSFMNYLSSISTSENANFDEIEKKIYYLVGAGSSVVDVIGYDSQYDFDLIDETFALKLNSDILNSKVMESNDKYVAYGFGDYNKNTGKYAFEVYYYKNGSNTISDEHFIWYFNTEIAIDSVVSLTYEVELVKYTKDRAGIYDNLETNKEATLYPVDSEGTPGMEEEFPKPVVSYKVGEVIVKYIDKDGNELANSLTTKELVGSEYTTHELAIDGYYLSEIIGDTTGKYEDGTIKVTYIYERVDTAKAEEDEVEVLPPQTGVTKQSINTNLLYLLLIIPTICLGKRRKING